MILSITDLGIRDLVQVLKDLRHGSIGFDVYRDPRTSTKSALMHYLLTEFSNTQLTDAVKVYTKPVQNEPKQAVNGHVLLNHVQAQQPDSKPQCTQCGIHFYKHYLKGGVCNGCRHPERIVTTVSAQVTPQVTAPTISPINPAAEQMGKLIVEALMKAQPASILDAKMVQTMIDQAIQHNNKLLIQALDRALA